ncbi:MAG TPA: CHAT domain-containing tetratricopeptide repeat protein [Candidatus Angelobacter sp.]|nr:CHAT domain-containing tetratricopeptide repeat protein [Candidatus Angelobacter sp.]
MQDVFQKRVFDRLAQLPTAARRVRLISRLHLLSPATVENLDEAVRGLIRTDLKKAEALADAAMAIAEMLGDKESQAFASRAKANALWFLGQHSAASDLNTRAIHLFREMGRPLEEARTLSTSIQPLILLGEYDRAQAAGERAREIFLAAGETVRLARLDINVANIFHRQDRFTEALEWYQRAYNQLAPEKDAEGIVVALHNMAVCLTSLNENEKAQEAYEQVRRFCQDRDMPLALAQAEYNIAYLYFLKGEYGRAIEMLRAAYAASVRAGDIYHAALCRLDLSEIYLQLNVNQESAELAQDAFNRFEQLGMGYEAAKSLCQWAIALSQQRRNFRALMLFAQARSMFVAEKNRVWPSLIDLYEAFAHFNDGRYVEARRYCASALAFFRDSPSPGRAVLCYLLLAKLSLKTGDMVSARQDCQNALLGLTGRDTPILAYQAHLVMGQIEEASHNLREAEKRYRAAKDILEGLRSGIRGEELKISFLENRLEVYEKLVGLCLARPSTADNLQQAWTYMEQAKSRNLLEAMVRGTNFIARKRPGKDGVAQQIVKLREQLNWYYHRIEAEQMTDTAGAHELLLHLRQLAEQHEKEFFRLLRELPQDEAEAAGLEEARPATLESVRKTLGPDATLIEYYRIQERILATVITQTSMTMVYVTTTSRVADIMAMLQQQFSQFHLSPEHIDQFVGPLLAATRERLHELYMELVGPVRENLTGKHLVVAPHEPLHSVPFHALFDGERYLIDSFTVSYAPSASIYVQCRQRPATRSGGSLVLGVATEQTPHVEEEIQSVAALLPEPKLFAGSDASELALRENGPTSRFIHVASHGFFRPDQPMFSGIRLGDTFLTLYDVYSLKLCGCHLTLSGCSTGLSVVASGDEIMGLTRGLLFAGARSLLLTLWDVNDSSTAEFMKCFYTSLVDDQDPALALQSAMYQVRQRYPHPYYWAPFILVGGVAGEKSCS